MLPPGPFARPRTRPTMLRSVLLAATLIAAMLTGVFCTPAALAVRPRSWGSGQGLPRVDVYGDSLSWLSQNDIVAPLQGRADVYLHVYPGTALCDWLPDMRKTAAAHPAMVLITFGGNYQGRSCVNPAQLEQQYENDARTAIEIFADSRVVLANDPQSGDNTIGNVEFDQAYQAAVVGHPNATVNYPGLAVSPGHAFTWTLPCSPAESATPACQQGQIVVRSSDTIHLTPAGEVRFGTAVAQPAVDAFPLRAAWGTAVASRLASAHFVRR